MMSPVLGIYLVTYVPSVILGIMLTIDETLFKLRVEKVRTKLVFCLREYPDKFIVGTIILKDLRNP